MADYTHYNHGSSNKGPLVALIVLAVFIIGLFLLAANAPTVEGPQGASAVETAPATGNVAPAVGTD